MSGAFLYCRDRTAPPLRVEHYSAAVNTSGIRGSGLDTLPTALRDVIRDADDRSLPAAEMRRVMAQRGKLLDFWAEEIEDLADMGSGDRRTFGLLALPTQFIDLQHHQFHIDHIFPRSRFTGRRLDDGKIAVEDVDVFMDFADRIANLQLLDGPSNIEEQAKLRAEWIEAKYPAPGPADRERGISQARLRELQCAVR